MTNGWASLRPSLKPSLSTQPVMSSHMQVSCPPLLSKLSKKPVNPPAKCGSLGSSGDEQVGAAVNVQGGVESNSTPSAFCPIGLIRHNGCPI